MRMMGETYLPREPAESFRAYGIRRNKAVLYNGLKLTVRGLTGMVFKRDPGESPDIPDQIRADMKNIDLAGTNFEVFCKDVFKTALRDGHCYVLIDYQRQDPNVVSRYDYERSGRRPYWLMYTKDQVINWRTETVNGELKLTQVTIEEDVLEADGAFGEVKRKQWRVLRPSYWEVYRENPNNTSAVQAPMPVDFGPTTLDYIPLIPVYTNKVGYFQSEPALVDLAHLNIRHFQIYSDYAHILHVANVPILWFVGRQKTKQQEVGPNAAIDLDEGGQMGFAEHGGSAIGGARTEILDLEERMNIFGLLMIAGKSSKISPTATEKVITKSNQTSVLSEMASSFKDAIEKCLDVHAEYYGLPDGGKVNIIKDLDKLVLDSQMLQMYIQMVKEYSLDIETVWIIMQQADLLPDEFDPVVTEANIKRARDDADARFQKRLKQGIRGTGKGGAEPDEGTPAKPPRPRTGPESFGQAPAS